MNKHTQPHLFDDSIYKILEETYEVLADDVLAIQLGKAISNGWLLIFGVPATGKSDAINKVYDMLLPDKIGYMTKASIQLKGKKAAGFWFITPDTPPSHVTNLQDRSRVRYSSHFLWNTSQGEQVEEDEDGQDKD